jgi:hypothetical protein
MQLFKNHAGYVVFFNADVEHPGLLESDFLARNNEVEGSKFSPLVGISYVKIYATWHTKSRILDLRITESNFSKFLVKEVYWNIYVVQQDAQCGRNE